MSGAHPYFTYTQEVLSWRLGRRDGAAPWTEVPTNADTSATAARAARILRAVRDRREVVLLGLGTGDLAATLAASLPPGVRLTVLCPDPAAACRLRDAGRLGWLAPDGPHQLVADASRQALFCLPAMAGSCGPQVLVTTNPEPTAPEHRAALDWLRRLFSASAPLPEPPATAARQAVTLAFLARPDEPGLANFCATCAGLAARAVIVWDARDVPESARLTAALDMPVRHLARPLDHDFAAQRNALLDACPPGWILHLDPDERPGPKFRDAISRLTAAPQPVGAYFPRLTLYPDAGHAKAGYGLWPDLQLRLFCNLPPARPRYVRPVHERLEGLGGPLALALDAPLLHGNRLLADTAAVASKLAAYDAAAGRARHHLSRDYPTLPLAFFADLAAAGPHSRVLLLPGLC
jgi:hypothetical protein